MDVIGLRELPVDTPFGQAVLQYWLCGRADGGPHAEFVPEVIRALPVEQFQWLREHTSVIDQALMKAVRDERERPGASPPPVDEG